MWLFQVQGLNLNFSLLLYIFSCPFFLLLLTVLAARESRVDSSALAWLPAGVISCDDLSVSTPSQFATDWLKNTCHQVIRVHVAERAWGRTALRFPCALGKGLQPTATGEQLCSWWALDISGVTLQDVKEQKCEAQSDVPSLKEGISLKWNCIWHCDSIRISVKDIGWKGFLQ